jgi:hypothetical protein
LIGLNRKLKDHKKCDGKLISVKKHLRQRYTGSMQSNAAGEGQDELAGFD